MSDQEAWDISNFRNASSEFAYSDSISRRMLNKNKKV